MMRAGMRRNAALLLATAATICAASAARGQERDTSRSSSGTASISAPMLRAGTIAIGLSGSLTVIDDVAQASLALRGTAFLGAPAGLFDIGAEIGYAHTGALDRADGELLFNWSMTIGGSGAHPFAGIGGGVRQEWLGSFSLVRTPLGAQAGVRALLTSSAAIVAEYRFRRIMGDPVADYSEHQVRLGVEVLF